MGFCLFVCFFLMRKRIVAVLFKMVSHVFLEMLLFGCASIFWKLMLCPWK